MRKLTQYATQLTVDTVVLERKFGFWRLLVVLQVILIAVLLAISFYYALTVESSPAYLTTHSGRVIPITARGTPNDPN